MIYLGILIGVLTLTVVGFTLTERDYRLYRELTLRFENLSEEEKSQFAALRIHYIMDYNNRRAADRVLLKALRDYQKGGLR